MVRSNDEIVTAIHQFFRDRFGWSEPDIQEFDEQLRENDLYIAGSFPLQMAMGVSYEGSDLDLWIKDDADLRGLFSFLILHGGTAPILVSPSSSQDIEGIEPTLYPDYQRLRSQIGHIYRSEIIHPNNPNLKTPVQIVVCSIPPLDVIEGFDLTICRVAYQGVSRSLPGMGPPVRYLGEGTVADIDNRRLRPGQVEQSIYEWIRTLTRMVKYYRRGFQTIDYDAFNQALRESQDFSSSNNRLLATFTQALRRMSRRTGYSVPALTPMMEDGYLVIRAAEVRGPNDQQVAADEDDGNEEDDGNDDGNEEEEVMSDFDEAANRPRPADPIPILRIFGPHTEKAEQLDYLRKFEGVGLRYQSRQGDVTLAVEFEVLEQLASQNPVQVNSFDLDPLEWNQVRQCPVGQSQIPFHIESRDWTLPSGDLHQLVRMYRSGTTRFFRIASTGPSSTCIRLVPIIRSSSSQVAV